MREGITRELRDRLQVAQNRMKQQADKHRKEKEFSVGDWVYLKLQPYRQISVATRRNPKLSARYYGPYEILERVGQVAYKLRLPENAQIHPVFHVSLLKSCHHAPPEVSESLPQFGREGQLLSEPEKILSRRLCKRGNQAITEVLVKWKDLPEDVATWEEYENLQQQFPTFDS